MKFIKSKLMEISLLLMCCSIIVNILFYVDIASENIVQVAFVVVIIFNIFVNFSSANNAKSDNTKNKSKSKIKGNIHSEKSPLSIIVTSIITISWALSFVATMF